MRPYRTPGEEHAISSIVAALRNEGRTVEEIPGITDRPDAALLIDGILVAVECRTFTPERVLRLHGLDMPDGHFHQLYLPLEPHIWLATALSAKAQKIEEYKRRTGASNVWLIAHSVRGMFSQLASLYERGLEDLFHIAAFQTGID